MPHPLETDRQVYQGIGRPKVVATAISLALDRTHAGKVVKTTTSNLTVTLPLASTDVGDDGRELKYTVVVGVAATTGGGVTLAVTGANKVNGGTSGKGLENSGSTDALGDSVTVVSDGADWWTMGKVGTWDAEA